TSLDLLVGRTIQPAGGGAAVPLPAGVGARAAGGGKVPGGWLITSTPAVGQNGPDLIGLVDATGRLVWSHPGKFLTVAPGGRTAVWLTITGTREAMEAHDTATGATTGTL